LKFEHAHNHDLLSPDGKKVLAAGVLVSMSGSKEKLQKLIDQYPQQDKLIEATDRLISPRGEIQSVGIYPNKGLMSVWITQSRIPGMRTSYGELSELAVIAATELMRKVL